MAFQFNFGSLPLPIKKNKNTPTNSPKNSSTKNTPKNSPKRDISRQNSPRQNSPRQNSPRQNTSSPENISNQLIGTYRNSSFYIKIDDNTIEIWGEKCQYDLLSPFTLLVHHKFGSSYIIQKKPDRLIDIQFKALSGHSTNYIEYDRDGLDMDDIGMPNLFSNIMFGDDNDDDFIFFSKNGMLIRTDFREKIERLNPMACTVSNRIFYFFNKNTNFLHEIMYEDKDVNENIYGIKMNK